jgi:hypothetical protein
MALTSSDSAASAPAASQHDFITICLTAMSSAARTGRACALPEDRGIPGRG